ncbi:MAG: hypothetical protein C4K58_00940 [Flavobacteriaceae bacterium]|nr:MAG: hypothetical protein C4K58_00940 [Flavobacteriaceae bacterium]
MKYYLIAGEASGDLHGANLMGALKQIDPLATFRVWGGDLMAEKGAELVSHYKDRSFMGFLEVAKNLPKILGFLKFCKEDIQKHKPDVVVYIDNSGFNLRIAPFVKKLGIPSVYYISPQVWASRKGRVKTILKSVDKMLVELPFVKDFYKTYSPDFPVEFVGKTHPIEYFIAKRIVTLEYISLVNLIWGDELVKELIQDEFNPQNISQELKKILESTNAEKIKENYFLLKQKLGGEGASKRAAKAIYSFLVEKN